MFLPNGPPSPSTIGFQGAPFIRATFFKERNLEMAISNDQKSKLKKLGLVVLGGLAGIFAQSSGVVGKIASLVNIVLGVGQ